MQQAVLPEANPVLTKIATLGGPISSVMVEAQPPRRAAVAGPTGGRLIKKQQRAREAAQRRRMAARARQARQARQALRFNSSRPPTRSFSPRPSAAPCPYSPPLKVSV